MSWSATTGIPFGPRECQVFDEVCRQHAVNRRLMEELFALELSEKRRGIRSRIGELIAEYALLGPDCHESPRPLALSELDLRGAYRFRRIELKNYCVFANATLDLRWDPERPLALVEGQNGYGKTKLLEAIQFCLYGTARRDPLGLLHAGTTGPDTRMEVKIDLATPDGELVRLRRFYDFQMVARQWELLRKAFVVKVGESQGIEGDEAQAWVDARLPEHVLECFLFDAERSPVAALAANETNGNVAEQLERVLGITGLRELQARLRKLEREWFTPLQEARDQPSVRRARAEIEAVEAELEAVEQGLNEQTAKARILEEQKRQVDAGIEHLLGQFDPAQEDARLERRTKAESLRRREAELRAALLDAAGFSIPILLLDESIHYAADRARTVQVEEAEEAFNRGTHHALRGVAGLVHDGLVPWHETPMPSRQDIVDRLIRLLGLPPATETEARFGLPEPMVRALTALLQEASRPPTPGDHLAELRQVQSEIATLGLSPQEERAPSPSHTHRDRLNSLRAEAEDLAKQQARLEDKQEGRRKKRSELEILLRQRQEELRQAQSNESSLDRKRAEWELIDRAAHCAGDIVNRLRGLRVEDLERGATDLFRQLTNKPELYDRVVFDRETLRFHVRDHEDRPITPDPSTGERTVLALAVVHGLQMASGRSLPLAVEAPLKPLDPIHTDKVVRHVFCQAKSQVILLVKPDEVSPEHMAMLQSRVGQRFILERPDVRREMSRIVEIPSPVTR